MVATRFTIAVMLFMITQMCYMTRVNLSINLVAMVESTTANVTLPDFGPRYSWSQREQGFLLSSYFIGYTLTSFPGGTFAEQFGGSVVVGGTSLIAGLLTVVSPAVVSENIWNLVVVRFFIGLLNGVVYPCCHNLISKWAPPDEKSRFTASLMGGTFGTVFTWALSGPIIQYMGWEWAFLIIGLLVIMMTSIWFNNVADAPSQHTTISPEEREYIENSLSGALSNIKRFPPYKSLCSSIPFWALLLLHYGNMWGLYFLLTATPKFLSQVLHFKLVKAGFLSSLPYLVRLFSSFAFGCLADLIRRKKWLSVTQIRKIFCIPSHFIPGTLLLLMPFFDHSSTACVAIMAFSLGFNGAATATNLVNSQDLAPNFAGTLYGIINCAGTTAGILSPLLVAAYTLENNTKSEWHQIFKIGGLVYIIPAIIFCIFGSGDIQPWNEILENKDT